MCVQLSYKERTRRDVLNVELINDYEISESMRDMHSIAHCFVSAISTVYEFATLPLIKYTLIGQ